MVHVSPTVCIYSHVGEGGTTTRTPPPLTHTFADGLYWVGWSGYGMAAVAWSLAHRRRREEGGMQPSHETFWNGRLISQRIALKLCRTNGESFAQLLVKQDWLGQVRSRCSNQRPPGVQIRSPPRFFLNNGGSVTGIRAKLSIPRCTSILRHSTKMWVIFSIFYYYTGFSDPMSSTFWSKIGTCLKNHLKKKFKAKYKLKAPKNVDKKLFNMALSHFPTTDLLPQDKK